MLKRNSWSVVCLVLACCAAWGRAGEEAKTHTNAVGMKFVLVPAGSFIMGTDKGQPDERPIHKVNISKPFYLGTTEVTQAQYEKVMGKNPSKHKGADMPINRVSWLDAQAFCKKLSAMDEAGSYRLPSEAEWEHACRAGSKTLYYWGDGLNKEYGWFRETSGFKLHPVAKCKANAWGLYDMAGNAWEWCQDFYARNYAPGEQTDPTGPPEGPNRILRGGSFYSSVTSARSANRRHQEPEESDEGDITFRVVYAPKG